MTDYPVRLRDYSQGSYGKRHISNSGKVAFCRAEVHACPRGRHFNSEEEAKFYIEQHPQGEVKPVTELVPMKSGTTKDEDRLALGRTKQGDIYEFTLLMDETGPRLDRGKLRNAVQEAGGRFHSVVAFENSHKARIQITVPGDNEEFDIREPVNAMIEQHSLYDGEDAIGTEDTLLEHSITGYKSINTGRKLLPKATTATEVLKAAESQTAITGPDAHVPEGYFAITAKVLGYTRTYVLKGDPGDQEAPVIGRIDSTGTPEHPHTQASAGSGILGGQGLIISREGGEAEVIQQMIKKQDQQEAKPLARV